jgi:hypothetical protein
MRGWFGEVEKEVQKLIYRLGPTYIPFVKRDCGMGNDCM